MNEKENPSPLSSSLADEKHIETLIKMAGYREAIDPACAERVYEHVFQVWQKNKTTNHSGQIAIKHRSNLFKHCLIAACFLLFVASFLFMKTYPLFPPTMIAEVKKIEGETDSNGEPLQIDRKIYTSTTIKTGNSGALALSLFNGGSIKLDKNTSIFFIKENEVRLNTGAIYYDSEDIEFEESIIIRTSEGVATDIGTQFEVRLYESELKVRVRDGQVKVESVNTSGSNVFVEMGQELNLNNGSARIIDISENTETWIWADSLADKFSFNGRSMAEMLQWISHKESWQLVYKSDVAKNRAKEDILYGELPTNNRQALLKQLSLISEMIYYVENQTLFVDYLPATEQ